MPQMEGYCIAWEAIEWGEPRYFFGPDIESAIAAALGDEAWPA